MSATESTEVTHTTMTSDEYVALGGVRCPHCGSDNLNGGSFDVSAGAVYQNIDCGDCWAEWTDEYTLTRYSDLVPPDGAGEIMTPE